MKMENDPLQVLIKSPEEIKKMREDGELAKPFTYIPRKKRKWWLIPKVPPKLKPGIAIEIREGQVLKERFESFDKAAEWAKWNYKGQTDYWRIREI